MYYDSKKSLERQRRKLQKPLETQKRKIFNFAQKCIYIKKKKQITFGLQANSVLNGPSATVNPWRKHFS